MTALRRAGALLAGLAGWPRRAIRRRISLQLVISHTLAVLLTLVAVESAVIATLIGLAPDLLFPEGWDIDMSAGEKARTVAFVLDQALLDAAAAGDADARTELERQLRAYLVEDEAGTAGGGPSDGLPDGTGQTAPAALTLPRVAHALIADPRGIVLASTDPVWAPPGQPATAAPFDPVGTATNAALSGGAHSWVSPLGMAYALEYRDHVTVGAHPIVDATGRLVGVVTLQAVPFDFSDYAAVDEIVWEWLKSDARSLAIITLAGLAISIPIGFWRARTVSRRLKRLARAADAVATGDLSHPVADPGEDEIARVAERFDEMRRRLAETDRARRALVANVSHDLRTPVAIMQGNLERILEDRSAAVPPLAMAPASRAAVTPRTAGGDGSPAAPAPPATSSARDAALIVDRELLAMLHRETVTLSLLIDDLFTLARVEETTLPLTIRVVAVARAVDEAIAGLKELAWEQSKVTILTLVDEATPAVLADRTRLRQILNNLLYNALRHTPTGGLIVVSTRDAGTHVEISVADTGVGIPAGEQANIFDRFWSGEHALAQGDEAPDGEAPSAAPDATAIGRKGSGLGLHIVKQLVEAMHGTIRVESEPGQGTIFRFSLPRA